MIPGTSKNNYTEKEIRENEGRALPNMFESDNGTFWKSVAASALILHPAVVLALYLIVQILALLNIHLFTIHKPPLKTPDIEFVITQKEAEPINKNTPYRSDKNSRAGGINDPNRKVSVPSPAPAPKKPTPKQPPAPPKQVAKPQPVKKQAPQPVQKVAQQPKPAQQAKLAPAKPAAPVQRPVMKPSTSAPKPQVPKLATAPTSPFKVEVPKTGAPVGSGFSTTNGTASTGGSASTATGSSTGTSSSGMPAPQFSTTRSSGDGRPAVTSQGGTGTGGYGTGNMGNPGPGNPSGAPGVDAIKSPQWGPYMRELESKIKRNWHPPKGDQSKRVVLLFKIGRRGELLSVRVSKSSGSPSNDEAAIQAVQMSAPFRALPPEFTGSSVEIDFTFDYNVLGASYR